MQEVIDELLKAETEAQQLITRAQEEAQKKKNQVEADYSLKVNETREQARKTVLSRVEKTRREITAANAAALKQAQVENDQRFLGQKSEVERITDEVIDLIMTPEYERDGE